MLKQWTPERLWYYDAYQGTGISTRLQRMVIIRLHASELVIISPVELTTQLQLALSELGNIATVVAPSPNQHQHLSDWWLAYPQAYFIATPTVVQKRTDLNFDAALSNQSFELWKGELLQTTISGLTQPRKTLFCDPISQTLILPDFVIGAQSHLPKFQRIFAHLEGARNHLKYPIKDRLSIDNPAIFRAGIQQVMTWPFDRIIASNGIVIESQAKQQLSRAFNWLF
ncbi:hypothetical protein [Vibrio sp. SCSIO 43136]|uniref:hypothetical protein n=1 Tax=Vibrio sp. SCSIO 43136 TaxID=2819101 RepID=UPI002074F63C|nr:hypothetical protein [Vibrio sp. SCSIO 43136]USD67641.1 hypothetical protein J4N39_15745 [Vibrio sp. SCSIO 43136]